MTTHEVFDEVPPLAENDTAQDPARPEPVRREDADEADPVLQAQGGGPAGIAEAQRVVLRTVVTRVAVDAPVA